MDERTLGSLVDAGAVKVVHIIASGATIHVKVDVRSGESVVASTARGATETWSATRWLKGLGVGTAKLDFSRWTPGQRGLKLE